MSNSEAVRARESGEKREYSPDWFKHRAFSSLKQIGQGTWDYSDSLLLYVPGSEDSYEKIQKEENSYHALVTQPEREYLAAIASPVVSELPSKFRYVDLGPGTEHKEQFIFDAARAQGKEFTYIPVDISDKFLNLSATYASAQGIPIEPLQVPFEELPSVLKFGDVPHFVSLGLTYSNFDPESILRLLQSIAGKDGFAFINAQLRERVDMNALAKTYREDAIALAMAKMKLLGLGKENVETIETDDGIRSWCVLASSTPELEAIGMHAGDRLLVFESLRPERQQLEEGVKKVFAEYTVLDTGASFVGVLLKN